MVEAHAPEDAGASLHRLVEDEAGADAALELLQGDRSFLVLVEDGEPVVVAARAQDGVPAGEPSMSVVLRCLSSRREIIAADLGQSCPIA